MQRLLLLGRWLALSVLSFVVISAATARTAGPIEVQVVVRSVNSGPDAVSFVYSTSAKGAKVRQALEAQARQDFQRLAATLGQPAATAKVSTVSEPVQAPPTTSVEGKLPQLVNRSVGWLNIGPLLKVFARYDRLSLTYFVEPPFQFRGPRGPFENPSLAMSVDEGGMIYTYHVRIKQHPAGLEGAGLPGFEAPSNIEKLAYLLVALMALTTGVAVYALLQYWVQRKSVVR